MERNYLTSIKALLDNTADLASIPTGMALKIAYDPAIKCVLFDIYGTLVISASGDIDQAEVKTEYLQYAFDRADIAIKLPQGSGEREALLSFVVEELVNAIKACHQDEIKRGNAFPEVDILEIWNQVLHPYINSGEISLPDSEQIKTMAFVFELLSNKLAAMPAMQKTIRRFQDTGMPLGIVSNAQFYTPVVLNYMLNGSLEYTEGVVGFQPDLTIFSYQQKKAKPDVAMFRCLLSVLRDRYGLQAHEVAFVGNDMLKDIYAASQVGFKTVLFAGDQRSLRLRGDKKEVQGLKPDYIIDNLLQLLEITGLGLCSCSDK